MAEDNFDPFEDEDFDMDEDFEAGANDDDGEYIPPKVKLSHHQESTSKTNKKTWLAWRKIPIVRIGQIALVLAAILFYPAMTVASHKLDDSPVVLDEGRYWAVGDIGVMSSLIARELDGPGWVADRHPWRPQARLTALPAWQDSLLSGMSDHGRLLIALMGEQRDQDLIAAIRLMSLTDEDNMTPRLLAATEAFARFDGRVAGGVTAAPRGADAFRARLGMTSQWATTEHASLARVANPGDGWIASPEAIKAVYRAKAKAHLAHEILLSVGDREATMLARYGAGPAYQDTLSKWRRAANLRPLFVSNQGGNGLIGANHPAIMAFLLEEARTSQNELARLLSQPVPATPEPANAERPDL